MIVRLLLLALFGFLVYTLVSAVKRALQRPPAPPPEKTARGEEMVLDPECGTYVPRSDALTALVAGERRYFCSARCRDAYQARK